MPCHVAAWLPARNPRCPLRPASHVSTRPTYYIFFFMSCYFISIPFISFPFLLLYLLSFLACYYQCFCFLGLTLYLMSSSLLWNTHSRASSSPEECFFTDAGITQSYPFIQLSFQSSSTFSGFHRAVQDLPEGERITYDSIVYEYSITLYYPMLYVIYVYIYIYIHTHLSLSL